MSRQLMYLLVGFFCVVYMVLVYKQLTSRIQNAKNRINPFLTHDIGLESDEQIEEIYADSNCSRGLTYSLSPRVILYNKVPKCGSSSLQRVLGNAARSNGVQVHVQNVFNESRVNESQQAEFVTQFKRFQPYTLVSRHICHPNFTKYDIEYPAMINMIRNPVSRFISKFYYKRQYEEFKVKMDDAQIDMGLSSCVEYSEPECEQEFDVIPFFCGQEDICRHKTRNALDRAIHNVCKHYSIVGYLENMEDFLGAVEYLYPKYFRGAPDIYNSKGDTLHVRSQTHTRKKPSLRILSKLRDVLSLEYEFYEFIVQRFHQQYKNIFMT